jgi:hypothetical protein
MARVWRIVTERASAFATLDIVLVIIPNPSPPRRHVFNVLYDILPPTKNQKNPVNESHAQGSNDCSIACPGVPSHQECHGNGICTAAGTCICRKGYRGSDCSLECPGRPLTSLIPSRVPSSSCAINRPSSSSRPSVATLTREVTACNTKG